MNLTTLLALAMSLLLSACVNGAEGMPKEKERGQLGTAMVNLSQAADMYLSERSEPPKESDAELLRQATRHDPSLMSPAFSNYLLKLRFQQPYTVLLLCTKDGREAIMEDAGCSARLDRQVHDKQPCEFTLQVSAGCRVDGADPK